MIEINLIPEELRNRVGKPVKTVANGSATKLSPQLLILCIPVIFVLLVITHSYFIFLGLTRTAQLKTLKAKWENSLLQRKSLEEFNAEYSFVSTDARDTEKLLLERVNWSEKLNKLSLSLPAGVWLEYISVSGKEFYLRGKAVSLDKAEVSLIRNYVDGIKNQPQFMKNFSFLEISSIKKSAIGAYEIADFSLTGAYK